MSSSGDADHKFKVVIVGGGITGLTLAICLQQAGIDYVLLEARQEIAPQIGASVCLGPSALRILDQLGLCDQILERYVPIARQKHWKDGKCFASDDYFVAVKARWGYDICCFDRHILLQIIYGGIAAKSRIQTGKRFAQVDHREDGVAVHCEDGSVVLGDVVVGADGVHSAVRREMWRYANESKPGTISTEEQSDIKAEYNCLFGISKGISGIEPGTFNRIYSEGASGFLIAGKEDKVHWFFFSKLDKVYRAPDIPRYAEVDIEDHILRHADWRYTEQLTLADLWKKRTSWSLTCVEEFFLEHWTWGRFLCLGDSVHKATPNAGLGAAQAIESCVAFTNALQQHLATNNKYDSKSQGQLPSGTHLSVVSRRSALEDVKAVLTSVQKKRWKRAEAAVTAANILTKLEALDDFKAKLLELYVLPRSGDFLLNKTTYSVVGAEKIKSLPDPPRSYSGTACFNPNYGVDSEQSMKKRVIIAFPLLLLGYQCFYLFSGIQAGSGFKSQHPWKGNSLVFPNTSPVPFSNSSCGPFEACDRFLKLFVSTFSPSILAIDPISYHQSLSFLTDAMPLFMIWVLESYRRNNAASFARFPLIFATLAQLYGVGAIGPVYFFLHYVQTPLDNFLARDHRMVNIAYASTALPALLTAYGIPHALQYFALSSTSRLQANAIWQPFPVLLTLTHWMITAVAVKDTTPALRLTNPSADMKHIRLAMLSCIAISSFAFNYVRFASDIPLRTLFIPNSAFLANPVAYMASASFLEGWRLFLQLDEIFGFGCAFVWLGLLLWDLKHAGMLRWGWMPVVGAAVVVGFVAGPGAVVGALWMLREECLNGGPESMRGAVVGTRGKGSVFVSGSGIGGMVGKREWVLR